MGRLRVGDVCMGRLWVGDACMGRLRVDDTLKKQRSERPLPFTVAPMHNAPKSYMRRVPGMRGVYGVCEVQGAHIAALCLSNECHKFGQQLWYIGAHIIPQVNTQLLKKPQAVSLAGSRGRGNDH